MESALARGTSGSPRAPHRLRLPALFAPLYLGWPLALGAPHPWWVLAGALGWGGLFAWASAGQLRAGKRAP